MEKRIEQLEVDFKQNNSHNLFKAVKEMEGKPRKVLNAVKDKDGKKHTNARKVLKCWEEHFDSHLNTEFPHEHSALDCILIEEEILDMQHRCTIEDIATAIKEMKARKAPGVDEITAEVLKAGGEPMLRMLEKIFCKIWDDEISPSDWQKMLVSPIHKKGDKLDPANYRAISLLSVPGKVFSRMLLNKIKLKVEQSLGESQFGFRVGRGTVDAIFVVR